VFAVNSTAWVLPGILGPSLATLIEHAASWHWVFLGLLPLVVIAAIMAVPPLARLRPEAPPDGRRMSSADKTRLVRVGLLVLGVGAVFAATSVDLVVAAIALAVIGLPVGVWAFVHLVPAGTIRLEHGLPSVVGVRGLLTWAFFGCDAYVSLAVTEGLGGSTLLAGLVLTATSITWTAGSWVQERWIERVGPRRLDVIGFALVAAGTAAMLVVATGLPPWTAIPAWAVGGLGMGLAYSPLSVAALACAPAGQTGAATASLQLSDTLGISIGTGLGGAAVALADGQDWTVATGVGIAFAASLVLALIGLVAARTLPARLPTSAPAD
jgi:MFS family permease